MTWSGLIHPPRLQHSDTETGQQRNASRLELFFDLAFVLVVAELAVELRGTLTLHGVLVFAGLFASVWWAWAGFTIYANRFDTDDVVYRLAKLTAMLAVVGLAASTTEATGLARQRQETPRTTGSRTSRRLVTAATARCRHWRDQGAAAPANGRR